MSRLYLRMACAMGILFQGAELVLDLNIGERRAGKGQGCRGSLWRAVGCFSELPLLWLGKDLEQIAFSICNRGLPFISI